MAIAKDIMTPNPLMVGSGNDILEVVEFFNRHHISSAPVQNPLGQILGQLTEIDLVKALVFYRANSEYSKIIHAENYFQPVSFVRDTDEIPQVLKVLVKAATHRVLVMDRQEKVVGIISPKDLLRSIQGAGKVGQIVTDQVKILQFELGDLRRRMQEMAIYLQTYDTVFQSGFFGLHSINKEGKVVFANDRIHECLGYQPGELLGRSFFDLYPPEAREDVQSGLEKVMAEGRHNLIMAKMVKKTGELLEVDLASSALKDEMNRFIGTFTISRVHGSKAMSFSADDIFGVNPK